MINVQYVGAINKTQTNLKIEKNISEINRLYNEGLSISKIGLELGIDRKAIARLFKNNNLSVRSGYSYSRKHHIIDEHYFDEINTEEKAYILGFIYADGNNFKPENRISIKLNSKDEEILQKFSNIIYGQEFLTHWSKSNNEGKVFFYTTFNIFSEHISQTLEKHGVVERKSKLITFPDWLDKNLYRHFIRGLIDGDGCLYFPAKGSPATILISTTKMNDFIKEYIANELGLKSYKLKAYKQNIEEMYYLKIKGYKLNYKFLNWLYDDSTIYLKRKHDLYLGFIERAVTIKGRGAI